MCVTTKTKLFSVQSGAVNAYTMCYVELERSTRAQMREGGGYPWPCVSDHFASCVFLLLFRSKLCVYICLYLCTQSVCVCVCVSCLFLFYYPNGVSKYP